MIKKKENTLLKKVITICFFFVF